MDRKTSVHASVNAIARATPRRSFLARVSDYLEDWYDARIIEFRRRTQKPGDTVSIGELMKEYGMAD